MYSYEHYRSICDKHGYMAGELASAIMDGSKRRAARARADMAAHHGKQKAAALEADALRMLATLAGGDRLEMIADYAQIRRVCADKAETPKGYRIMGKADQTKLEIKHPVTGETAMAPRWMHAVATYAIGKGWPNVSPKRDEAGAPTMEAEVQHPTTGHRYLVPTWVAAIIDEVINAPSYVPRGGDQLVEVTTGPETVRVPEWIANALDVFVGLPDEERLHGVGAGDADDELKDYASTMVRNELGSAAVDVTVHDLDSKPQGVINLGSFKFKHTEWARDVVESARKDGFEVDREATKPTKVRVPGGMQIEVPKFVADAAAHLIAKAREEDQVQREARKHGIDPDHLRAIVRQENTGR